MLDLGLLIEACLEPQIVVVGVLIKSQCNVCRFWWVPDKHITVSYSCPPVNPKPQICRTTNPSPASQDAKSNKPSHGTRLKYCKAAGLSAASL